MGNKNKTVSFRVNEDTFDALRDIAEERDLSLSAVFRDYVDALVANDGRVDVVPTDDVGTEVDEEFPPKVEVPKSFVREHERLELEAEHLREQLDEHKAYINALRDELEEAEDVDDVVHLDDLESGSEEESFHLG
ncbi:transcriptional/translational regulatory protein YebC/TACO1 [Halarchaeum rubridurum]|uniref:CopG family transcriptional regulator n=1 Tax=Halarchaeum rubridurum TaxID=489911 RepID=A0A830FX91_9EURY|nr:CopG family transcriptional regulator [Halarchaeum rubridurum]MBP1954195.1 transcriptional/translational regulatory protein YebC/TACO1 [Halarchaeum rubridurum]GGM58074.1 CopG family transcriptional regulator [Halarchaeum rubridurum]